MDKIKAKKIYHEAQKLYIRINCLGETFGGCVGENIKSHSLQRSGVLSKLVDNKNEKIYALLENRNKYEFVPKQIKSASTFLGFCKHHDAELFKPIEKDEYQGSDLEHFLYAFRCNSHMYYQKVNMNYRSIFMEETAKNDSTYTKEDEEMHASQKGDKIITISEITDNQRELTKRLKQKDWKYISTTTFDLDCNFNFTGTYRGSIGNTTHPSFSHDKESMKNEILNIIKYTYLGLSEKQLIRNVKNVPLAIVYITVIPKGSNTRILLSYETKNKNKLKKSLNFLKSLGEEELKKFFSNLFLEQSSNVFLNEKVFKANNSSIKNVANDINHVEYKRQVSSHSLLNLVDNINHRPEEYLKQFDLLKKPSIDLFIKGNVEVKHFLNPKTLQEKNLEAS